MVVNGDAARMSDLATVTREGAGLTERSIKHIHSPALHILEAAPADHPSAVVAVAQLVERVIQLLEGWWFNPSSNCPTCQSVH